ncbi:MAG: hypothetical protein JWN60_436 [Acidobacteria bacterium]|nr:hypothetical protein [Acidobacteriota bacterium]
MKTTLKLMLIVTLFASAGIADDGNMGNGGKTCVPSTATPCPQPDPQPLSDTSVNSDSTGMIVNSDSTETAAEEDYSILRQIQDYLSILFG